MNTLKHGENQNNDDRKSHKRIKRYGDDAGKWCINDKQMVYMAMFSESLPNEYHRKCCTKSRGINYWFKKHFLMTLKTK